jgi:hypothetical protein
LRTSVHQLKKAEPVVAVGISPFMKVRIVQHWLPQISTVSRVIDAVRRFCTMKQWSSRRLADF